MAYADQQMGGSRVTSIIFVALIHVAVGYLLISGLAISAVKEIAERVTAVNVEEPEEPPEPEEEPPPPEEIVEPPPTVPPPPIPQLNQNNNVEREPDPNPTPRPTPDPTPRPTATATPTPRPTQAPSKARGASTRGEGRWAGRIQENYPSRALREEIEGTVGVAVTVTPDGRATNCRVTASSGSSILDDAACRGMERYARFNPALDRDGNETTGSYSTRITYRLN
ncbi:energy transducer TonB [Erythrobacter longus]|uniref:Protein TonB n=1 Tax=Erythrobacter longus TaxID=1044 RepID=A0A074M554_ERYLO|nr:energy transducer TonB [Erythrobacter longus]KEO87785.1 energy transducer TonB [Erythrobacter longus]